MKKIIYTTLDGRLYIVHPAEGARLAFSITFANGEKCGSTSKVRVDSLKRRWPIDGAIAEWAETEEEFLARIKEKDVPADAINTRTVDAELIPVDREFRNAWKIGAIGIEHDMPKAREIKREQLRELRKPKMEALDVAYIRADELGDTAEKRRIAARKQALRDVTKDPAIEAAQTTEELKAVLPDALK